MLWTREAKLEAAIRAPTGVGMLRDDTRVIERPGWYQLVTPSAAGTALNEIVLSEVEPSDAEGAIDEAIATYHAGGHPVKWCVGPWTRPGDFGEVLARRGFRSWNVRGMGCETSLTLGSPRDVVVEEIDETTVGDFLATALLGWSVPHEQADLERAVHLRALAERPRVAQFFAARADGVCLGTAGLLMRDGYGYLVGTQVLESARGRGIYRALVGARLAFLRARGLGFAVTHAREATSAPMLEHLGFETLFRSRCFVLDPPSRTSAP